MSKSQRIGRADVLAKLIDDRKHFHDGNDNRPSEFQLWSDVIEFRGEIDDWVIRFRKLGEWLHVNYCDFWLEPWSKESFANATALAKGERTAAAIAGMKWACALDLLVASCSNSAEVALLLERDRDASVEFGNGGTRDLLNHARCSLNMERHDSLHGLPPTPPVKQIELAKLLGHETTATVNNWVKESKLVPVPADAAKSAQRKRRHHIEENKHREILDILRKYSKKS